MVSKKIIGYVKLTVTHLKKLRSTTWHMGSVSVKYHTSQANVPHINPNCYWWLGVAVTCFIRSTKLLYARSG